MKRDLARQIGGKDPLLTFTLFLTALLPGVLILFIFYYGYFYRMDSLKAVLTGTGLAVPFICLNYISAVFLKDRNGNNSYGREAVRADLHVAACVTSVVFYGGILAGLILYRSRVALLLTVTALELAWLGVCFLDRAEDIKKSINPVVQKRLGTIIGGGKEMT
ncbi:MAG: hypothetical protein GF408_03725 [Candidatus Omnitrophica bacterium]|nr:hypothetical protein [Candidatus Omnitrophota bacterium]